MGKNQGFKASQRQKHNASDGGAAGDSVDGLVDASWHTPEWHAARIAALQVERLPWDEWKKRQKEEEARQALAAGEDERMMQEYRAQLAADREKRLSKGINHADLKEELSSKKRKRKHKEKKDKKEKKEKRKKDKKDGKDSKRKRDKSPKKAHKSRKKHKHDSGGSSSSSTSSDSDGEAGGAADDGPMRLSEYLKA